MSTIERQGGATQRLEEWLDTFCKEEMRHRARQGERAEIGQLAYQANPPHHA